MYRSTPGAFYVPLAGARQGTQVHYRWAQRRHQQQQGSTCIAVFRSRELRRLVYGRRSQPLHVVTAMLIVHDWEKALDHEGEVSHVH
jgi:hypothetical protein